MAAAPTRSTAARALVEAAIRAWWLKFPTSKIDDCAVVCLFLNGQMTLSSQSQCLGALSSLEPETTLVKSEYPSEIEVVRAEVPANQSRRLADCLLTTDEEEWSALDGVTRVNSLINLPRFLVGDRRSNSWRKWL